MSTQSLQKGAQLLWRFVVFHFGPRHHHFEHIVYLIRRGPILETGQHGGNIRFVHFMFLLLLCGSRHGRRGSAPDSIVDSVLSDLARRETRLFTQLAAREAVGALKLLSLLHKTPLRSARFRVLTAPDVPSILIELGYLSNADDVSSLTSPEGQKRLGLALAAAIERFFVQHGQGKRE